MNTTAQKNELILGYSCGNFGEAKSLFTSMYLYLNSFAAKKASIFDNMLAQIHTKTAGGYAILSNIPNIIGVSMLVSDEAKFAGKRVVEASFPDWMRIAFIQRLNTNGTWESLRPSPDKTLLEGDRLIIFCSPERVVELEKRFKV